MQASGNLLHLSSNPHVRNPLSVSGIMVWVLASLVPCIIAAGVIFGVPALILISVTAASAYGAEILVKFIATKSLRTTDASALVSGLILGLMLPSTCPLSVACAGAVFSIVVVKQAFGGIGRNFLNPALAGRLFIALCYPSSLASVAIPLVGTLDGIDGTSMATPLAHMKMLLSYNEFHPLESADALFSLFKGTVGGACGAGSVIAILIGGTILVYKRIISLRVPVLMGVTVFIAFYLFNRSGSYWSSEALILPLYQLMSGGVLFAAFFVATDPVSSPLTRAGKTIFAIGCGLLIVLIRLKSNAIDGVCFAILFMNLIVPLINRFAIPVPYGKRGFFGSSF